MPLQIFCIEKSPHFAIYWALTPHRDEGLWNPTLVLAVTLRASPLGLAIIPYSQSHGFFIFNSASMVIALFVSKVRP
jgi:hypothetical protein